MINDKRLLGEWIFEPNISKACEAYENSTLEFKENGQLDYTIHGEKKEQKIFLTYRVENNLLITDQPSHPHEVRTPFAFTEDGKLILMDDDQQLLYVRA